MSSAVSPSSPASTSATDRRHDEPLLRYQAEHSRPALWSSAATWQDLTERRTISTGPSLAHGWTTQWSVIYADGTGETTATVTDVSVAALLDSDPIRTASWHPNATARAGLHYVSATDEHSFHDSLFERNLLIALDFHGVSRLASQPFTLTWRDGARDRRHTPDFIIEADRIITVVNVRPTDLVNDRLLEDCAAIAEVCLARGWQHALVVGYPRPAFTNLAHVAAHRTAEDSAGYAEDILDLLAECGPTPFGQLADKFEGPVVARAIIQRLIWDREVSIDLNRMLGDATLVALPGEEVAQ